MEIGKKIAVIVPAYNEEKTIVNLINEIQNQLNAQIIVVNDASTDDTEKIIKNKINDKNVQVVTHLINLGGGAAVQTGVRFGLKLGCKYFIQVDGDGQHPPTEITKVLGPILNDEADLVIGSRYLEETKYRTSLIRKIGISGSSKTASKITGKKITDVNSGFRAFNNEIAEKISENYDARHPTFKFTVEICKKKFKVKEISVLMEKRNYGTSEFTTKRLLQYPFKLIFDILRTVWINVYKTKRNYN